MGIRKAEPEDVIQPAPDEDVEKFTAPAHQEKRPSTINSTIDPEMERRVVRKLDWHLPTLMAFFYLLAALDRSNIGNAKIAGMEEDLGLDSKSYAWLLTIFYISYTVFEVFGLMWKVVKPHQWAALTVFSWGLVSTCQAATTNWQGMMALRFLMGAFEAAFGPGVVYLMSFFYRRHELGLRCGFYAGAAPLANTFAGALAYGITSGHAAIASWRVLFLVEGLPVCAAALLAWFFVPDSAETAKFLTEEEREVARARALQQSGEPERAGKIQWKELLETLLDVKAWITAEMGFTAINAQGLTAPPFFASFLATIASTWVADRTQQRGLTIIGLSVVGGVGYILCATCTSVGARYFGVFLAACGVFPSIANILPWVLNNQGSDTRRGGGIVLLNIIGQCGPFLGTNSFPDAEAPRYIKGMSICAAFMFFTAFLAACLRVLLIFENRGLEKKYGPRTDDPKATDAPVAEDNYGANFRYVL
ncbi:unnamed protein product [Penicillium bialowiezense]